MRETLLILHFIGLAMGLGTSFAFMFLGIAASKMEKSEAANFTPKTFVLSRMGHTGITLLVITGLFLMTPFWPTLGSSPLLIAKLILVLVLGALLGMIGSTMKKVQNGEFQHVMKLALYGRLAMITSLAIVVLAVIHFK